MYLDEVLDIINKDDGYIKARRIGWMGDFIARNKADNEIYISRDDSIDGVIIATKMRYVPSRNDSICDDWEIID